MSTSMRELGEEVRDGIADMYLEQVGDVKLRDGGIAHFSVYDEQGNIAQVERARDTYIIAVRGLPVVYCDDMDKVLGVVLHLVCN